MKEYRNPLRRSILIGCGAFVALLCLTLAVLGFIIYYQGMVGKYQTYIEDALRLTMNQIKDRGMEEIERTMFRYILIVLAESAILAALFLSALNRRVIAPMTKLERSAQSFVESRNNQLCEGNEAELFVTVWLGVLTISTGHPISASAGQHRFFKRHP